MGFSFLNLWTISETKSHWQETEIQVIAPYKSISPNHLPHPNILLNIHYKEYQPILKAKDKGGREVAWPTSFGCGITKMIEPERARSWFAPWVTKMYSPFRRKTSFLNEQAKLKAKDVCRLILILTFIYTLIVMWLMPFSVHILCLDVISKPSHSLVLATGTQNSEVHAWFLSTLCFILRPINHTC